ncbi:MAG: helix-turn-helix transcriptional regulator [Candidatus Scalindua sp.]|jgi:transcriptional regulator with XRE-family HTH domain|nr:helix-turn-helix transcriptional regulator [Candidatus Scalindua sp.]
MSIPEIVKKDLQKLSVLLRQGKISQQEIASSTQVDQSQISRILSGKIKRVSSNVIELCKYSQSLDPTISNSLSNQELISEAALQLWDGSTEQANALQKLFNSLAEIQDIARRAD